jgi:hypothetical protein
MSNQNRLTYAIICLISPNLTRIKNLLEFVSSEVEKWNVLHMMTGINPVFCIINLVIALLLVCTASTLSAGFAYFCDWLLESEGELGNMLDR